MLRSKSFACSCSRAEYVRDSSHTRRHSRRKQVPLVWRDHLDQKPFGAARSACGGLRKAFVAAAAAEAEDTHVDFLSGERESAVSSPLFPETVKVTFQMPHSVPFGQEVVIAGDAQVLGSWSLSKAKKLLWNEGDLWTVTVDLPANSSIQYKYAIMRHGNEDVEWMPGTNFTIRADPSQAMQGGGLVQKDVWGEANKCKTSGLNGIAHGHGNGNGNGQATMSAAGVTEGDEGFGLAENYTKMTVKDIKVLLKARGLPVSGRKAELIQRLVSFDA